MLKVFNRFFNTTAGRCVKVFQKWKGLPLPRDDQLIKRCNRLERVLTNIARKNISRNSFEMLKECLEDGEACKKRAIRNLLQKTMSQHKRLFLKWHSYT